MFGRILKKDLKRQIAANVIVLIFISIASTFISGSVNSILSIGNGVGYFFEKAGMPAYVTASAPEDLEADLSQIHSISGVSDVNAVPFILLDFIKVNKVGETNEDGYGNFAIVSSDNVDIHLFDRNGNPITEVEPGTVLMAEKEFAKSGYRVGDTVEIHFIGQTQTLRIAGVVMDAMFGASTVSVSRIVMNPSDFKSVWDTLETKSYLFCISTDNVTVYEQNAELSGLTYISMSTNLLRSAYALDIVVATIFAIVSICLIIISCVVLKFTISSTISEEFREIGVMKAIGLGNTQIRLLYLVKYLVLSVIGAAVGFGFGILFGDMLIQNASKTILLGSKNYVWLGILSSVAVVAVVVLLCFKYTSKIKHLSPIDAVSNAISETGTSKKRRFKLQHHHGKAASFLAINDFASKPRKFITMIVAYTLCLLLTLIATNLVSTVLGRHFVRYFGMTEFDICCTFNDEQVRKDGVVTAENYADIIDELLDYVDEKLVECGYPGRSTTEFNLPTKIEYNGLSSATTAFLGIRTTADEYEYTDGTAPMLKNEIAVSSYTAEKLQVHIGDTVTLQSVSVSGEFLVTGIFQSCVNLGDGVRLNENADVNLPYMDGMMGAVHVDFDDTPNNAEIERRIEVLKDTLGCGKIVTSQTLIDEYSGITQTIQTVRNVIMLITVIIVALITVLMERSFAIGERSEIALVKAVGFKPRTVYLHHTLRFVFVGLISTVIALALSMPVTTLSLNPVFAYLGAKDGIKFEINALEVFVINPLVILGTTAVSAFLTSLFTKSVKSYDTASIE